MLGPEVTIKTVDSYTRSGISQLQGGLDNELVRAVKHDSHGNRFSEGI